MGEDRTGDGRATGLSEDRDLLAELSGMLDRVDPPPGWLEELARESYGLRSLDLEIAELVADSQVDRPTVAVRGQAGALAEPRLLSFEAADLLIDLQISYGEGGADLAGQLVPACAAVVEVRRPGHEPSVVVADHDGRFLLGGLRSGPLSLVCRRPDATALACPWVLL